ncbi:DUF2878 domain-containing protein [Rhodanobacter sp. DHG33]|uniref:DUF2878 domain-containing protein n=1 Tax=Rhodanobacter sp. DHG33 TaxID=2775921 RepID=UPI001783997C|nr:DUF2878 domain-containing protein [Rhodanobacter sp. DHG33]MBD8898535.1 DUF2878 domain-containing protein [Rhodanobacter sp. DHG33]
MSFWLTLIAYEAVWFAAVIGAGHGQWWPGVLGALAFAAWRLMASKHPRVEARLAVVALLLGFILENLWVRSGLVNYATPWPWATAPAWLMSLWLAFALTIVPLFGYLHARPALAAVFGAFGGPLAYLGAARGWHAVLLPAPMWPSLLALAAGWAIALPLLTGLARRWLQTDAVRSTP